MYNKGGNACALAVDFEINAVTHLTSFNEVSWQKRTGQLV